MKKFLIIIVAVLLILVIAIGVAVSQAGKIIKHAVEEFGPGITGTSVTLDDVNVSIASGTAGIKGLVIGNPQGFKSAHLFKVDDVAIDLDVASLFSDRIQIRKILIDGAELTYELGKGGSNVQALQREIEKLSGAGGDEAAQEQSSETLMSIDDIYVNATQVNVVAGVLGDKGASVVLPDIHMEDVGSGGEGATAGEVVKDLTKTVSKLLAENVSKILATGNIREELDKKVGDKLDGMKEKLKGLGIFDK